LGALLLCIFDLNKPFGLHSIEILADIGRQVAGRIQYERLAIHAPEHNPVSEVFAFFLMMLDGQQRQIGQCLPEFEWDFVPGSLTPALDNIRRTY
jgi:hypothetical protein